MSDLEHPRREHIPAPPRVEQPQVFPAGTPALIYALCAADPTVSTELAGAVLMAMTLGEAAAAAILQEQEDDALAHTNGQLAAEEARSAAGQHQRSHARSLFDSHP